VDEAVEVVEGEETKHELAIVEGVIGETLLLRRLMRFAKN